MIYVVGFIVLLGLLVLAHELGHFMMGKLCKVKIEAFSIGFGKPILRKKHGETEYRLCMIPLGGYVKFLGDDPEKDAPVPQEIRPFIFTEQKLWKRSLIVFAGPLCNFILAVVLFAIVYIVGEPNVAPVVGYVENGSIAWDAGIRQGDEIVSVNGKNINVWSDIDDSIEKNAPDTANVVVKRNGEQKNFSVKLKSLLTRNRFGEPVYKNLIQGIAPYETSSMVGVSDVKSKAYKAGFRTGDLIVKADDKEIKSWKELNEYLTAHKGNIKFKVKRLADRKSKKSKEEEKEFIVNNGRGNLGFYPSELFVMGFVKEKSPAKNVGIMENDRIVAVNGKQIGSFITLQQTVDEAGRSGSGIELIVDRGGKISKFNITPQLQKIESETTAKEKRFLLGIETNFAAGPFVDKKVIIRNPIELIVVSIQKTLLWIWITIVGLAKLFTGAVSLKSVGGPLMIGKVAGDSLSLGIAYFLRIASIISINLGIINLVPIPVLDGGHLMFFGIEAITRRPVKEKYQLMAQQVGFYLLMGLIGLSFFNDILRFFK